MRLIVLIAAALLAANVASAAPKYKKQSAALVQAEALATHGTALYRDGYHLDAAAKFMEAYVALRSVGDERPLLLFNAGRAFQEAKRTADALVQFRAVMRHELADGSLRAEALKRIDELERTVQTTNQMAQQPSPDRTPIVDLDGSTSAVSIQRDLLVTGTSVPPSDLTITKPRHERQFPIVKGSAALALGATALGTWAFAYSQAEAARAIEPHKEADITRYGELRSSAEMWQIVSISCGVAGSALAVWTAADWYVTPMIAPPVRDGGGPAVIGARMGATF